MTAASSKVTQQIPAMGGDWWLIMSLVVLGGVLTLLDAHWGLHTLLSELMHASVLTVLLGLAWWCQRRYPQIRQFGWPLIVWGVFCLVVGSWVDILDDPPTLKWLTIHGVPFGRSWEQAFLKKVLGYTLGNCLVALGFVRWIPWMIETRQKLAQANTKMNQLVHSLDDHLEAERLRISRVLHDDVAQQLTFLGMQVQLAQKEQSGQPGAERLKLISEGLSESLKSIRQMSRDLRPESLYALGLVGALEQFLEKLTQHTQMLGGQLQTQLLCEDPHHALARLETEWDDRKRLHLYRLVQEAVNNSLRHGEATEITVSIETREEALVFDVADNGIGFPFNTMPSHEFLVQGGHLGLVGMQERVKELNGTLSLLPSSGGARLRWEVPR
jgi:signal transduction histidine kinase